jgi:hypothetical protein
MFWLAGVALYTVICAGLALYQVHSFELLDIAARCAILLPSVVWALRRESRGKSTWAPPPWFASAIPLTIVAAVLSYSLSSGILVSDESAYRFQARIFATGHLTAEPLPGAVSNPAKTPRDLYFEQHILTPSEWTTKYYPGWPLFLAPFSAIHLQWLANPLLLLAFLWLTYKLARRWFDEASASTAVLLMSFSPFLLAQGVGDMSDLFCAVLIAGVWLLLAIGLETHGWVAFTCMFALVVVALLARPFSTFEAALALGLTLAMFLRGQPRRLAAVLAIGLAFAILGDLALRAYNHAITGQFGVSPYAFARGGTDLKEITFNPATILSTATKVARRSVQSTIANTFPFLFVLAAWEAWRSRRRPRVLSLAILFPLVAGLLLLQPEGSGSTNGERYYVEALFAVAILAAAAITRLRPPAILMYALLGAQLIAVGFSIPALQRVSRPFERVHDLAAQLPIADGIVYLASSPGYMSHLNNPNAADWRHAPLVYLVDPGEPHRAEVARQFGRVHYAVLTYDVASGSAKVLEVR